MNIHRLLAHCRTLPGVQEDVKWGNAHCCMVAEKLFAIIRLDERGQPQAAMSIKVDSHRFLELSDLPGIQPAPYLARNHWLLLEADCVLPDEEVEALISRSWHLIASRLPKRQRETLGLA
ncbi:MmcQ/YjbR family DNA-binding protein [Leeia aquatica]|uniref:MmcQ/YjbR family DNA-binding protein n=1 Tax=Leeia aquatica TaxID=2725557 RepID=A0A847S8R1_9NEIS|nr:MmcQ/YjbR family DNA-binding protein [Leeia aquatica]NLR73749.1 MmcQ/YjbR family DNA-binding protein [Leeia aquatica]